MNYIYVYLVNALLYRRFFILDVAQFELNDKSLYDCIKNGSKIRCVSLYVRIYNNLLCKLLSTSTYLICLIVGNR